MSVRDFPPRPQGAQPDSVPYQNWLDALGQRQNIDLLQELTSVASGDEIAIFDASETGQNKTKKVTVTNLLALAPSGAIVNGASFATTSGTAIDIAIASGVKRVILHLSGVSVNANTEIKFQLGDSGGVVTSGYAGSAIQSAGGFTPAGSTSTAGFVTYSGFAGNIYHGHLMFALEDESTDTWVLSGFVSHSNQSAMDIMGGSVSLSGELTTIRMASNNGTATFDAGKANIQYWI